MAACATLGVGVAGCATRRSGMKRISSQEANRPDSAGVLTIGHTGTEANLFPLYCDAAIPIVPCDENRGFCGGACLSLGYESFIARRLAGT